MRRLTASILTLAMLIVAAPISGRLHAAGTPAASGPVKSGTDKPEPAELCPESYPPDTSASGRTPHGTLTIMPATRWQPVGGVVQFELTGMENPPKDISVYFAWQVNREKAGYCHKSQSVRLLPNPSATASQTTYLYAAQVSAFEDHPPWFEGIDHWEHNSTVPMADIYVHGVIQADQGAPVSFILTDSVGITTVWFAGVVAGGVALIGLVVLVVWAGRIPIPGCRLVRIISTPNGVASLSQFQILIWTAVIATGVVYVIMLSGYLIDIPTTTLGLLGVSGVALVGSKLHAGNDGSPQRVSAPGTVTNLDVLGTPTSDTVVLTWVAPAGTAQPLSYTIQKRLSSGGSWETVANNVGGPPYAVIGLQPSTPYEFQVFAINQGGPGSASVPLTKPTAARSAQAGGSAGGPSQVMGLQATAPKQGPIELGWATLVPAPDSYSVQYRKAGTLPWATYSTTASPPTLVAGLDSGTTYEFQVFAVAGGIAGSPSHLAVAKTPVRKPRLSDLVMSSDDNPEVDLARVQMLAFTSVAALFTGLTLFNTGTIPDIPVGELALVGVSNGVYLASKVAGRSSGD